MDRGIILLVLSFCFVFESSGQTRTNFAIKTPTDTNHFAYTNNGLWIPGKVRFEQYSSSTISPVVATWDDSGFFYKTSFFTEEQKDRLRALVFEPAAFNISVSPTFGEKGDSIPYSITFRVIANDNKIDSGSIIPNVGNITDSIDGSFHTITGLHTKTNITHTLRVQTDSGLKTTSATVKAYVPQWAGKSNDSNLNSYSDFSDLQKYIQSSPDINILLSPTSEYIWFVSNKSNAVIRDVNDFVQTIGNWGDITKEFWYKPSNITLLDGTSQSVYIYRSRNTKILTNFTYKIQ